MDWQYRGEGNCSLVVASSAKRKVYRLIKKNYTKKFESLPKDADGENKVRAIHSDLQQIISYTRWVMQPLLSPNYVVLPKLITVDKQFVTSVVKHVSSQRPARRLKKSGDMVDEESLSALVLPDFCFVPGSESLRNTTCPPATISVEIKPKKSFICPDSSDEILERSGVCKFCMHQHLKARQNARLFKGQGQCQSGQWPETSDYCPLDLFSGNEDRMKHALQSLIKTPQNNFKLWRDGEAVYSAETKEDMEDILHKWFDNASLQKNRVVSTFLDMVIKILLMSVSQDDPQPHSDLTRSPTLQRCQSSSFMYTKNGHRTCQWLSQGCVLERVLAAQLLDDLDIMTVYQLYLKLMTHLNTDPQLWSEWGFDGHFPQNWLLDSTAFNALEVNSIEWAVQKVKRFLVSKTLQDCSIMVAIRPITNKQAQQYLSSSNHGNNLVQFADHWYKVSVALVDLDPKPLDKIPTYYEQASAIRASFEDISSPVFLSIKDVQTCASTQITTSSTATLTSCSDSKARKQGQTELL